ncbi:hypothetical protein CA54_28740 [Symmachiella macrocystis]|uniref:Uncharacterized protein n=1 Tax=Symmachiella macrocystis TaxID=2527985 RepID=A0A5C6BQQ3_9PLAN|nr:hypothetical protein [Symmachiella macrocystis]TWU14032.1 hypothetical protein CA54_28740 [Symmachiella macrocystis]
MADATNSKVDYWQASQKLLGGSFFCGLVGAMCNAWIGNDSLVVSMMMDGAIGALLGTYIAMSFEGVCAKMTAMLFANHSSQANAKPPTVSFARGVNLARFVCLFLIPPFLVVCSFALVGLSFAFDMFGNGHNGTLELAQGLFWFVGLYFSNTFLVAAGTWIVQGICWIRIRGQNHIVAIPTQRQPPQA